ncbi:sigma-70 family RNA polymerase sigma factor [Jeotgalibacillus terrae]|uniref:RNA polymerase sigma factor n=1 Tax=Jeotgalibacillus terrae TaxID=587735 RepID=A0ABW5ZH85_9BACL|nr:RNA polymerase sigma-70 factor (ECF subfamily) [Jeotgalibacillus terrae]
MDIQEIYQRYVNDVYRYLLSLSKDRELAEDLTQETFIKVFGAFDYNPPDSIKAWLFKVAYHTFIDYLRKNKHTQSAPPEVINNMESEASAEESFVRKEETAYLYEHLALLKNEQKQAIVLCDLKGYSLKEAALEMEIKVNTLKSYLFRGRGKLKMLIRKGRGQIE